MALLQKFDRFKETSTTTGTGALTLSGAFASNCQAFSAVLSVGDTVPYFIEHQTAAEWETGYGTYSSANTLTRTTVLSSSNAGAAVNFSAGTKPVGVGPISADIKTQTYTSAGSSSFVLGTGKFLRILGCGSGAGGGGGRRRTNSAEAGGGGSGGSAGTWMDTTLLTADIIALGASTLVTTVGAGGSGGAGGSTDGSSAFPGNHGADTSVTCNGVVIFRAFGGRQGGGGT